MVKLMLRVVLLALLVFGLYWGTKLFLTFRFSEQVAACTPEADRQVAADPNSSETQKMRVTARAFVCVAKVQGPVDRWFFDVRKFFDDPSKWPFPIEEYQAQLPR